MSQYLSMEWPALKEGLVDSELCHLLPVDSTWLIGCHQGGTFGRKAGVDFEDVRIYLQELPALKEGQLTVNYVFSYPWIALGYYIWVSLAPTVTFIMLL